MLKYAYITRDDGIIFWRSEPNPDLPYVEPPPIMSHSHDLLLDGHPVHSPYELHSYMDGTWGSCLMSTERFERYASNLVGLKRYLALAGIKGTTSRIAHNSLI